MKKRRIGLPCAAKPTGYGADREFQQRRKPGEAQTARFFELQEGHPEKIRGTRNSAQGQVTRKGAGGYYAGSGNSGETTGSVRVQVLHTFLRTWRKSRKLTLDALAERLGSKVSTLSGWETGRRQMDLEDLAKLAEIYGVHPAALLFAPGEAEAKIRRMQEALTIAERMTDGDVDAWLEMGRRLVVITKQA